jgi:hypothetical protein
VRSRSPTGRRRHASGTPQYTKVVAVASTVLASLALAGPALASPSAGLTGQTASHHAPAFQVKQVLDGTALQHTFIPSGATTPMSEALSKPDDLTFLGHHLFTAFQNGVGPQGEASSSGNTDSTVVEFTGAGKVIRQWDIKGKCDGLTADPGRGELIATVNEDANSSVYTIKPGAPAGKQVRHYQYNKPLPHFGGTDAISIYHGAVFISASAPGTTGTAAPQPSYPAVYSVVFRPATHVAVVKPLFFDEATATVANVGTDHGKKIQLALIDPDSNEVVPGWAHRFAGDFMLTSQGDQEQIFAHFSRGHGGKQSLGLSVLGLSRSVDDTAWPSSKFGRLYGADTSGDTIDVVTGPFRRGSVLAAVTPCDQNDAPATCPGPGFPANFLGSINPRTGQLSAVPLSGPAFEPQGLVFVGPADN